MKPEDDQQPVEISKPSEQAVRDRLRGHGLRVTKQRETIYAALAATARHPSADELFGLVQPDQPGMSLATVYNTLEAFVDAGLCRRIHASGATRYDAATHDHVHVCTRDGRVLDVPEDLGRNLVKALGPSTLRQIEQELGVSVASISLELPSAADHPSRGD
ncbi:MAG: Fur family transcriptional regulator [Planctomycetota bacterium]